MPKSVGSGERRPSTVQRRRMNTSSAPNAPHALRETKPASREPVVVCHGVAVDNGMERRRPRSVLAPNTRPKAPLNPATLARGRSLPLSSSAMVATVVVAGACIGLGDQVWAIAERLSHDPLGFDVLARADRNEVRLAIAERMAATPGEPLSDPAESLTALALTSVAPDSSDALARQDGLTFDHQSFAPIQAGVLRFPHGAVETAWTDADTVTVADETASQTASLVLPSDRRPPSDLWVRVNRPAPVVREPASEPRAEGWRFVPASFLPVFGTASADAPQPAPAPQPLAADGPQTATILFGPDGHSLDARACGELDRIADILRDGRQLIDLRSYGQPRSDAGTNAALRRAWAIRAYLVARGVPASRIAVNQAARGGTPEAHNALHRVDVTFTAG